MKHNFDKYCGMMTGLAKDLSTIDIMLQVQTSPPPPF